MAAVSGKSGTVTIGSTVLADVTSWTADHKVESDRFGSSSTAGWKTSVAGTMEITGTVEAKLQENAAPPSAGDIVQLSLATGGGHTYSGNAMLTTVSVGVDLDTGKAITLRLEFESDGEWTITTSGS